MTHLSILDSNSSELTEFVLTRFLFPKLKSLHIQLDCYDSEPPWQSIQKLTQLEYFMIVLETQKQIPQWLTIIRGLPKLRLTHFYIPLGDAKVGLKECRQVFNSHPSLRSLNISSCFKGLKCFKDILENKVICQQDRLG